MRTLNIAFHERCATRCDAVLNIWTDEQAQDLTDFTILVSFFVIAAAGLLVMNGSSAANIWADVKAVFSHAGLVASGSL